MRRTGILFLLICLACLISRACIGQTVSDATLTTQAQVIRDEPSPGGNTKLRIYNMFKTIIDSKPSLLGTYVNPSWITSLPWSKITTTPTTISGYGITDPIVLTSGSYANPAWITSLAFSKLTSLPTTLAGHGITIPIPVTSGGTGLTSLGSSLQSVRVNSGGTALEYYTPVTSSTVWLTSGVTTLTGTPVITGNIPLQFTGMNNFDITTSASGGSGNLVFNIAGNHTVAATSYSYTSASGGFTFNTVGGDYNFNRSGTNRFLISAAGQALFRNLSSFEVNGSTVTNIALGSTAHSQYTQNDGGGNSSLIDMDSGDIQFAATGNINFNTGTLTGQITSGTYTPTLTNTTNVAASTPYVTGYYRIGNAVTVYGKADIDATLFAGTDTELGMSLPVASDIAAEQDLGGTAVSDATSGLCARIKGDLTNNRASIVFKASNATNDSYAFQFSYQVK